ncbi:MAG: rhodanese-like domain-containing protein [Chloroflexi bacterium]|nr:rhodanese-like domain-containing protein [Chloroflexota bacterium]
MNLIQSLFGGGTAVESITAEDYKKQFKKAKKKHVLIDVRTAREFDEGHVAKSINIPLSDLNQQLERIPTDQTVVLICASGSRSRVAANKLMKAGYENIINLHGGTSAWVQAGGKLSRK